MTEHRFRDPGAATSAPPARGATLAGLGAILLWAALALFTVAAHGLPPFELLALSFGVACLWPLLIVLFSAALPAAALVVGGAVLATGAPRARPPAQALSALNSPVASSRSMRRMTMSEAS